MAASVVLRLKFIRLVPLKPRVLTALHLRKNLTQLYSTRECKCNQYSVLQRIRNTRIIPFARGFSSSEASNESRKVVQFKLSDIGEGIREVNVKEWFVKVGDRVAQFDGICEVQSDKASVTITSRYDGIITKLYYDIDDVALVGQPLVDIQLEGENAITSTDDYVKASSGEELASSSSSSSSDDESEDEDGGGSGSDDSESVKVLATPAVRHLASQKKVNLKNVKGTGKHGRILKEDVLDYIKTKDVGAPSLPESLIVHPKTEPEAGTQFVPKSIPSLPKFAGVPGDRSEVITGIRKVMVKSMTLANSIPHFCFCDEVDLSELVNLKPIFKEAAEKYGLKFSYTSVFIKAASVALTEFPLFNSTLDSECKTITYKGAHNIGVAMDTPDGLVVPNIKNVAQLSILEVASELNRLMQLGANGKLGPADLTGGTFTLSNIGMIGGTYTKPVIFVPEVVIGALGSIMKLPRFDENDKVIAAHVMNVSWSADHRIIDGATMARFSNVWKSYLENPLSLLLHLK